MNSDALTALLVATMFSSRKNRKVPVVVSDAELKRRAVTKERADWNAAVDAKKAAKVQK